jgi:hypothetical protein
VSFLNRSANTCKTRHFHLSLHRLEIYPNLTPTCSPEECYLAAIRCNCYSCSSRSSSIKCSRCNSKFSKAKNDVYDIEHLSMIFIMNRYNFNLLLLLSRYENSRQLHKTVCNRCLIQMSDLVGTINLFFSKISKGHIQFQLSEQYSIPKRNDFAMKSKIIKKDPKIKV